MSKAIRSELTRLSASFPQDLTSAIVFDTTKFVTATVEEIAMTLGITFVLVVLVTYIFLQDIRATSIPTLTVPVSLVGVFAILYVAGYSANTITLFALILAIGLVVDDAIVVVENVQRLLEEHPDISPAEASHRSMQQVTGPVVATTLVLGAVFVPVAFLGGVTGQLYRQFAVTITVSVMLSAVNALTLSPALASLLLRPPTGRPRIAPLRWFSAALDRTRNGYVRLAGWFGQRLTVVLIVFLVIGGGLYGLFKLLPTGFLPSEDQGYFFVNVQLPDAAAFPRTQAVMNDVRTLLQNTPGVSDVISVSGFSLLSGAGPNVGLLIPVLRPWGDRPSSQTVSALIATLMPQFAANPRASIVAFNPPPISGSGPHRRLRFRTAGDQRTKPARPRRHNARAARRGELRSTALVGVQHVQRRRAGGARLDRSHAHRRIQCHAGSDLLHHAGASRLALRQRLQPLQPRVPGAGRGSGAIPQRDRRHQQALRPQHRRANGAAAKLGAGLDRARARLARALQSISRSRDQRTAGGRT